MMNYLVLLFLLLACCQQSQAKPNGQDSNQPLTIYDPASGEELNLLPFLEAANSISSRLDLSTMGTPCSCQGFVCKCCLGLGLGELRQNLCVTTTLTPEDASVNFVVALNDNNVLTLGIPARDARDFCVPIPITYGLTSFCLRIYNLHVANGSFSVCTSVVLKTAFGSVLIHYKLGCLQLGFNGVSHVSDLNTTGIGLIEFK